MHIACSVKDTAFEVDSIACSSLPMAASFKLFYPLCFDHGTESLISLSLNLLLYTLMEKAFVLLFGQACAALWQLMTRGWAS